MACCFEGHVPIWRARWSVLAFGTLIACGGRASASKDRDAGDGDAYVMLADGDGNSGDGDTSLPDRSCESTLECMLVSASCCGNCGSPSASDMTAVRAGQQDAHFEDVCGNEPFACPACSEARDPNLYARCVAGTCQAVDLTTHADSRCSGSEECIVIPAACCPCGAGTGAGEIVAINSSRSQNFREAQCAYLNESDLVACPECEWVAPDNIFAECVSGRCTLVAAE